MRFIHLVLLLLLSVLAGCEEWKITPVSLEGTPLVGNWYGERQEMAGDRTIHDRLFVQVRESGEVDYHFLGCERGGGSTKTEKRLNLQQMLIKRLTTVKMVLQRYPLTPSFELTLGAWPDQAEGAWVVDGIALLPVEGAVLPEPDSWQCEEP